MGIDEGKVSAFWQHQAAKLRNLRPESVTNLEEDPELVKIKIQREEEVVFSHLQPKATDRLLDLGSGVGAWSLKFASRVREVHAVEYCEDLILAAQQSASNQGIRNIVFHHCAAQDFASSEPFDWIFISGLLLYLNDETLERLLGRLASYSRPGTRVVLRDATGIQGRYELREKFSEALQQHYSAIYRTRDEYLKAFASFGFRLLEDQDMFPEGHALNKHAETRLRVYSFVKQG